VAVMIALTKIARNPDQPRKSFPPEHIDRLAASIAKRGLIQPITVRPIGKDRYQLVAGECRFRAHEQLGRRTIRAEIVDVDAAGMQILAIVENLQRQDMNPIEEANAYQSLLDQGYTVAKIVEELSLKTNSMVNFRLMLLNLTPEIQQLVVSGNLTASMAAAVSLVSRDRQTQLVRDIASGRYRSIEQVKHAAQAIRDVEQQMDAFASLPRASPRDLAALTRLESKIATVAEMVAAGFREGECVAAQRVSPDRVNKMVEQLALIRKHVLQMEHDLRRVATQSELRFETA
jgi:ParB family transcriptional regulator, chromosome partitioning protein